MQKYSNAYIQELIAKNIHQQATLDEQDILLKLIQFDEQGYITQLISEYLNNNNMANVSHPTQDYAYWERLADKILAADKQMPLKENKKTGAVFSIKKMRYWWAAAAIIILLVTTGIYWWNTQTITPPGRKLIYNDIQPGQNGAILTLADGSQVMLDTIPNGVIALQGGVKATIENGVLTYEGSGDEVVYNTMSTPRGRKYRLALADGTIVWLNAGSSITYPNMFSAVERIVEVNGEAYFEVAKSSQKFIVKMNEVQVEVLGTHFNTNNYTTENAATVTLTEGSVQVTNADGLTEQKIKIVPGQSAVKRTGSTEIVTETADVEQILAWTNDLFMFDNTSIEHVMQQLERWYDIEVVFNYKTNQRFSGTIPTNVPISTVLKVLELTNSVKFEVKGQKVTVLEYCKNCH